MCYFQYQKPEATKRELIDVTKHYRGLEVKQEPFGTFIFLNIVKRGCRNL